MTTAVGNWKSIAKSASMSEREWVNEVNCIDISAGQLTHIYSEMVTVQQVSHLMLYGNDKV